jgi:hypothetical protein
MDKFPRTGSTRRQDAERFAKNGGNSERHPDRPDEGHGHNDLDCFECRSVIVCHDERFEPNRDAGLAGRRRSFLKSANSRQAHCEPIRIASRDGPDEMG